MPNGIPKGRSGEKRIIKHYKSIQYIFLKELFATFNLWTTPIFIGHFWVSTKMIGWYFSYFLTFLHAQAGTDPPAPTGGQRDPYQPNHQGRHRASTGRGDQPGGSI